MQPIDDENENINSSKVYKISYKINMLPMLSEYVHVINSDGDT